MSDAILIQRFKEGDEEARKRIYEMVYQPLFYCALQLTADEMKAEDIVQESFVKFIGKTDYEYKDIKSLKNILFRIVTNACLDYLRWLERENRGMSEFRLISRKTEQVDNTVHVENEYANLIDTIMKAIPRQPKKRRQVLEYFMQFKEPKEIAMLMNINITGVYKHRDKFIEHLQKEKGIDPNDLPWPSDT